MRSWGTAVLAPFFTELKLATTGTDAPVTRLFITDVSPVTLDDVTSGFNIGANVSLDPALAELTGFTEADLREMLAYYRENEFDFDVESVLRQMADWYDHYVFSRGRKVDGTPVQSVASPILVLAYMLYFMRNHAVPDDLVDKNLRTDYAKFRHVITESRRLNGNYHKLEDIIAEVRDAPRLHAEGDRGVLPRAARRACEEAQDRSQGCAQAAARLVRLLSVFP